MNPTLPTVTGRMEMTHADFQHACAVAIADLSQAKGEAAQLILLLCEAIRCSREACELAQRLGFGSKLDQAAERR